MSIDLAWLEERVLQRKLNEKEKEQLTEVVEQKQFGKGDTIMQEGRNGGELFLIRSGSVAILRNIKGQRQRLSTVGEGDLLGEITFLTGEPATATAEALESVTLYRLSQPGFSKLMLGNQKLIYALFSYMLRSTARVVRKMNEEHIAILDYMTGIHK